MNLPEEGGQKEGHRTRDRQGRRGQKREGQNEGWTMERQTRMERVDNTHWTVTQTCTP